VLLQRDGLDADPGPDVELATGRLRVDAETTIWVSVARARVPM